MPALKNTKTWENLKEAFAGESQANRRYLYFAQKADVEGHNDVAAVFRSTAEGETGHAHGGAGQAGRDDQSGDQGTQPAVAPPAGHAEDHGNRGIRQSVDLVAQPRAPGCSDACSCTFRRRIGCF